MEPPPDFKILDAAWAVITGLIGAVWHSNTQKLKEMREDQDKAVQSLKDEQDIQRGHIAKLFDKLEEHGRRSEDRHNEEVKEANKRHLELLSAIHTGLAGKVDK